MGDPMVPISPWGALMVLCVYVPRPVTKGAQAPPRKFFDPPGKMRWT